MFCKWCGGNLTLSETRCKRCGREIPALSDCGGFYDLVPDAKARKVTPPDVVAPAKKNNKQPLYILGIVTLCYFVILIAQILLLNGKITKQTENMRDMKAELQGVATQIQELSEKETTPPVTLHEEKPDAPTEPPTPTEPELKEQNVSFAVLIKTGNEGNVYLTESDLGEFSDSVAVECGFDKLTGNLSGVKFTLKETNTSVMVKMNQVSEEQNHEVYVSYAMDNEAFGIIGEPAVYSWLYRLVNGDEWKVVPEEVFSMENGERNTTLTINTADMEQIAGEDNKQLELKCEVLLKNTEEGSFVLTVEGITILDAKPDSVA